MPTLPKRPRTRVSFETTQNPFYNSPQWRKLRKAYITANPLCVVCKEKGIIHQANVVDHIVPIRLGGAPLDWNNLQSLCHYHHNKKSGGEAVLKGMEKR